MQCGAEQAHLEGPMEPQEGIRRLSDGPHATKRGGAGEFSARVHKELFNGPKELVAHVLDSIASMVDRENIDYELTV